LGLIKLKVKHLNLLIGTKLYILIVIYAWLNSVFQ